MITDRDFIGNVWLTNVFFFLQIIVIIDKDMGHPSRRVITKSVEAYANANAEYNNEGIISVYCAILGAIVLGNFSFNSIEITSSW